MCIHLGTKYVTPTAYDLKTSAKIELCNRTTAARQRHYIPTHWCSSDLFVETLTYAYIRQTLRSIYTIAFSHLRKRNPSGSISFDSPLALVVDAYHAPDTHVFWTKLLACIEMLQILVNEGLDLAPKWYKRFKDMKFRYTLTFQTGHMVFIHGSLLVAPSNGSAERLTTIK